MADKNFKIGASLVLDGEKEYKAAIADVNKNMVLLASEAKKTAAAYDGNADSLKALTAKSEDYKKQAEAQEDKIKLITDALENAKKTYGENSDKVKEWQIKLNNAETQLIKTKSAIEKNEAAMKDAAKQEHGINKLRDAIGELKDKASHAVEPLEKVGHAAGTVASAGARLGGAAVKGAAVGVAALGTASIAAGKQLLDAAKATAEAGDQIDEASQRMKVSAETYQELGYAAKMSGVEMQTLETAAKSLNKSGSDLSLDEAIKQVASIKDESERSAKAVELFGSKAAYSMGPMLARSTEDIDGLMKAAKEMGIVMSNDAVNASAKFNDSLDNLKFTADAVKNNLVSELLPGATEVMDGLTGLLTGDEGAAKKLEQGVNDIVDSLETMIPQFVDILGTVLGAVIDVAPDIVISLADGIINNLDKIIDSAFTLIDSLVNGLLTENNILKIINAAIMLVTKIAEFMADNIDLIVNSAFIMIDGLIDGLLADDNIGKLVTAAIDIVGAIMSGLINNLDDVIKGVGLLIGQIVQALLDYDWSSVGKDIWAGIKGAFGGDDDEGKGNPKTQRAGGIGYIPYDGYVIEAHKGERLLTASQNVSYSKESSNDIAMLNAKLDAVIAQSNQQAPVNVNISGSAGAMVRALNISVDRENKRRTAFA